MSTKSWYRLVILALSIGYQQAVMVSARAENSLLSAPAAVKTILTKIDVAANGRKLPELSRYYSPNFTTSDGLNKTAWQQSLGQFWQSYSNLSYATTLESWQAEGNTYIATTTTKITGTQKIDSRTLNLQSTIQSRQKIVGGQIVQQQVLQERTQISSGAKPPTIEINLPDRLQTNAEYSLDAIVTEPLGEDVLMGATLEQPVSAQGYTQPANYKLELLAAGGLFKIARAPGKSGDYWLSTVFIRPAGMTTLTQRIHVIKGK
ncbi:nuclear transport factor 2 family protein [Chamaesiphon sp. VAR_48_metabat_135_sub]|uniref:nuclear transport factor 2 family protein n=1 Tax=Chamaesiphon sp. VAR_48_metabat_135_sub TaxID=2964699 RepID=UPI00286D5A13|nr:nuclear transport factor 2 family protein [Chamaesiphon sp. VAR_48_metabat_135_sub]